MNFNRDILYVMDDFAYMMECIYTRVVKYIVNTRISGYFVPMYCYINDIRYDDIIMKYEPEDGFKNEDNKYFKTFSDFFSRKVVKIDNIIRFLNNKENEHLNFSILCTSKIITINDSKILSDRYLIKNKFLKLGEIFSTVNYKINDKDKYNFTFFYLEPTSYHRVHMPISGNIIEINVNSGFLHPVNPKYYTNKLTPLVVNEKIIFVIKDKDNNIHYISCIAALGVGNFELNKKIVNNGDQNYVYLMKGEELITFKLGSSVVFASQKYIKETDEIKMNKKIEVFTLSSLI